MTNEQMVDEIVADFKEILDGINEGLSETNQFLERIAMALETISDKAGMEYVHPVATGGNQNVSSMVPMDLTEEVDPDVERARMMYGENVPVALKKYPATMEFFKWCLRNGITRDNVIVGPDGMLAVDTQVKQRYDHR